MNTNPEIDQDRIPDIATHFEMCGDPLFPEQRRIYNYIAPYGYNKTVLEAGCGVGIGTNILGQEARRILATDKLERNIAMARCLYPQYQFEEWDLNQCYPPFACGYAPADVVVAIEVFEHVRNPHRAMRHLLEATKETLLVSSPNGRKQPRPPENPYHVCEYTPEEMLSFIPPHHTTRILEADTFQPVQATTSERMLLYQIEVVK